MFGINWFESLFGVAVTGVIVVYLLVRFISWTSERVDSVAAASKHAFWVGMVAWLVSGLSNSMHAGTIQAPSHGPTIVGATVSISPYAADSWQYAQSGGIFFAVLAVLLVHAVGQLTWPAPKSTRRTATLEHRRMGDFAERRLLVVVAAVFALSVGFIVWIAFLPGYAASATVTDNTGDVSQNDGRIPGHQLALVLGPALLVLAAGTVLVMWLVTRRRQLETLTSGQNKTLRIISMNRLLRVSATVASGLGAIAGSFAAVPAPGTPAATGINPALLANGAVLVAMLFWKPPLLEDNIVPSAPGPQYPFGRWDQGPAAAGLSDSTVAALLPVGVVAGIIGFILSPFLGPAGPITLVAAALLATVTGLELMMARNYARHGTAPARLARPLPPVLVTVLAVSAAALLGGLVLAYNAAAAGTGGLGWVVWGTPAMLWLIPAACATAIAVLAVAGALVILRRRRLTKAAPALDQALRRRALFRVARTAAAGWLGLLAAVLFQLPPAGPMLGLADFTPLGWLAGVAAVAVACVRVRRFTTADFLRTDPPMLLTGERGRGSGTGTGQFHGAP